MSSSEDEDGIVSASQMQHTTPSTKHSTPSTHHRSATIIEVDNDKAEVEIVRATLLDVYIIYNLKG